MKKCECCGKKYDPSFENPDICMLEALSRYVLIDLFCAECLDELDNHIVEYVGGWNENNKDN